MISFENEFPDYIVELNESSVLYIHDKNTGLSIVRICGLNRPKPEPRDEVEELIDITLDYREDVK